MNNYHLLSYTFSGGAGAMFSVYWPGIRHPLEVAIFFIAMSIIFGFIAHKKVVK